LDATPRTALAPLTTQIPAFLRVLRALRALRALRVKAFAFVFAFAFAFLVVILEEDLLLLFLRALCSPFP
jgi:hypothetical protein